MSLDIEVTVDDLGTVSVPFSSAVAAPSGLAAAAVVGGGTFAANTYFWVVTGVSDLGETTASNEASAAIALNGSCNLTWNALPAGTRHVKVYRGTASGVENALIATLGVVTAYTDTGLAGTAATPPTTNTASIQDTLLYSGRGEFRGFSLRERTGSISSSVEFQDVTDTLSECNLSISGSETEGPSPRGVPFRGRVNAHVNSGVVSGTVYIGMPYSQG
jgi:hypothetical protein